MGVNPLTNSNSKHIDVRHRFFREFIKNGGFSISHVWSRNFRTPVFTKPLSKESFCFHKNFVISMSWFKTESVIFEWTSSIDYGTRCVECGFYFSVGSIFYTWDLVLELWDSVFKFLILVLYLRLDCCAWDSGFWALRFCFRIFRFCFGLPELIFLVLIIWFWALTVCFNFWDSIVECSDSGFCTRYRTIFEFSDSGFELPGSILQLLFLSFRKLFLRFDNLVFGFWYSDYGVWHSVFEI